MDSQKTSIGTSSESSYDKLDINLIPKIVKSCADKLHLTETSRPDLSQSYNRFEFEYEFDDTEVLPSNSSSVTTNLKDFKLKLLIEFNFEAPTFRNLFQINTSIKYNDSTKDDPFGGFEISINRELVKIYLTYLNNCYENAKIEIESNKNILKFEFITTDYFSGSIEKNMLQMLICDQLVFHITEIFKIYKSIFVFFEAGNSITPEEAIKYTV